MGTLVARQFLPTLKIFFQKKKNNSPDFGMNFGTQNTQGPLVLLLNMITGGVKIVEQCSDFVYSVRFKWYAQKNEGILAAP